ncbi:MAG: sulfite exporter TauE/SafE family protein [Planctomycetota bacterium]
MNTELVALIGTVIAASVVGSLHCAGMCGAFVAMAVGLDKTAPRTPLHVAYNGGRLVTYSAIGAVAGALGAAFDIGGQALGVQRAAIGLAAATMITIGLIGLARSFGVRLPKARGPKALETLFVKLHGLAVKLTPTKRAATIGLMTGLLPCGWLYAFALLAAGTAYPVAGAIVMAAFWLGTLPILITLGAGVRSLAGALGKHAPRAMSIVIVALGVIAATDRGGKTFAEMSTGLQASNQDSSTVPSASIDLPCCASTP